MALDDLDVGNLNSAIEELRQVLQQLGPQLLMMGKGVDENSKALGEGAATQRTVNDKKAKLANSSKVYTDELNKAQLLYKESYRQQMQLVSGMRGMREGMLKDLILNNQRRNVASAELNLAQAKLKQSQEEYASKLQELKQAKKHLSTLSRGTEEYQQHQQTINNLSGQAQDFGDRLLNASAELTNAQIGRLGAAITTFTSAIGKTGSFLQGFGDGLRDFERRVGVSGKQLIGMFTGGAGGFNQLIKLTQGKWMEMIGARGQDYFDRAIDARDAFAEEFGGTLTGEAASKLSMQARYMGVTVGELAKARRGFMTITSNDFKGAVDAQNKFVAEFKKKGLNTKDAFDAVAKYTDIMARNGGRFAQSFAKAAADAKKIGVDLKKVDAFGDSIISDYEGFLEKQAELGAMGFNFDSTKMAQVAESGDTGALMSELRSQLAAQGKDLTKMRRSEQLALSNAFGIPMEELLRLSEPKAKEDTVQDKIASHGERTANGVELLDRATLNQTTKLSALGMLLQKVASGIGFVGGLLQAWKAMTAGTRRNALAKKIAGETAGGGGILSKVQTSISNGFNSIKNKLFPSKSVMGPALPPGFAGKETSAASIPSLTNALKTAVSGTFADMKTAIGGVFGEAKKGFIDAKNSITAAGKQAFTDSTTWAKEKFTNITSSISTKFNETFSKVSQSVGSKFSVISDKFKSGIGTITQKFTSGADTLKLGFLKATETTKTLFTRAAGSVQGVFTTASEKIKVGFGSVFTKVSTTVNTTFSKISTTFSNTASSVQKTFSMAADRVKTGFNTVFTNVSSGAKNIFTKASADITQGFSTIADKFTPAIEKIKSGFDSATVNIKGMFSKAADATKAAFSSATETVSSVGDSIAEKFGPAVDDIKEKFGNVSEKLRGKFGEISDSLKTRFGPVIEQIKARFGQVATNTRLWFSQASESIKARWSPVADIVKSKFSVAADTVKNKFSGLFPTMERQSGGFFSRLASKVGSLGGGAASAVGRVGGMGMRAGGAVLKGAGRAIGAVGRFGGSMAGMASLGMAGLASGGMEYERSTRSKEEGGLGLSKEEAAGRATVQGGASAAGAILGGTLLPFLGPIGPMVGGFLGDKIGKSINDKFPNVSKDIGKFFTGFKDGVFGGFGEVKEKFKKMDEVFKPLKDAFGSLIKVFTDLFGSSDDASKGAGGLGAALGGGLMKALMWLMDNVVPPLVTIFTTLIKVITPIIKFMMPLLIEVFKFAWDIISGALSLLSKAIQKLTPFLTKMAEVIVSIISAIVNAIKKAGAFAGKLLGFLGIDIAGAEPPKQGDDVVSKSGYGTRSLVTPTGTVALNNNDTVVAYADDMVASEGVRLLSKGALAKNAQPTTPSNVNVSVDMSRLEQKLDAVVRAIGSMNVQMDGAKVGKVLVNAAEAGGQIGVFNAQSRATL
jgi:phage-related protein